MPDKNKWTPLKAKIDAMSNEKREARVQEIYAMEEPDDDTFDEFFAIMFGIGPPTEEYPPVSMAQSSES